MIRLVSKAAYHPKVLEGKMKEEIEKMVSEEMICPDCERRFTNLNCRRCGRKLEVRDGLIFALPQDLDQMPKGRIRFMRNIGEEALA